MNAEASFTMCTRETKPLCWSQCCIEGDWFELESHSQQLSLFVSSPGIANLLPPNKKFKKKKIITNYAFPDCLVNNYVCIKESNVSKINML